MPLTDLELERYSRQIVLEQWGVAAQERLAVASAIVVGAGALGSLAAAYLAGAGVGRVGIADDDVVELSNLPRQPLFTSAELGAIKAEVLSVRLAAANPEIVIEPYPVRVEAANAAAIVAGADVVLDCSDSFATRYLVNAACCAEGVPLVEAGVGGFEGLVIAIRPGTSACYECAFQAPPVEQESCAERGILGPLAGVVASIQALEALKLLGQVGTPLLDTLLMIDGATMVQSRVSTARRLDCRACGRDGAGEPMRHTSTMTGNGQGPS